MRGTLVSPVGGSGAGIGLTGVVVRLTGAGIGLTGAPLTELRVHL